MILATLQHAIVEQSTKQSNRNRSTLTLRHRSIPMSHRRPMNTIPRRSTGSIRWADSGFHESFAVETVIPSSNEDPTEEYDEDYWKERAIEIAMQDERYSRHSFNNTSPPSIDRVYSASVDTHPHPAKRSYASIDTTPGTSIDIKAAAFEKEKGNIPIPSRFTNTYIRSFAPQITSHDTIAEKMNAPTNKSEGFESKA
ncbi:hypothetical protein F2Q69_00022042 [Brassica cretica]|uniref:Uncharacterized protein n=1 Tax=Brassica cretica TaxID=69181 RepID=A0A8S9QBT6_BRACR|nr:hypothetical protein F2Q69_00022042 [Brassica cretica]